MKNSLLLCAALALMSCHHAGNFEGGNSETEYKVAMCMAPPPPSAKMNSAGFSKEENADESIPSTPQNNRTPDMIIRNANLRFSVDDYRKGRSEIARIIKSHNAWLTSENEENSTYNITNSMVIRVLGKDFDALVNGLSAVAKQINTKTISADDVTAEFVDITARLKTKKDIEAQYLDLLKRATKISDILEIEEKARVLREEIDAK